MGDGGKLRAPAQRCGSETKLKEHARKTSTKPLSATRPGENGVGDLMFIEGRHDVKTPFYVHVDVVGESRSSSSSLVM